MPLDAALSPVAAKRATACKTLMRQVQTVLAAEGLTPSALHAIKLKLLTLAKRTDLFPLSDFAMPVAEQRSHILLVDDNDGPGLYLTIAMPGKEAAPHDHGIWCVNAALSGRERQKMWRRSDDGSQPGHATLQQIGEIVVEPGNGLVMADHDIHSTMVEGDEPAVQLALYGYALARFPSVVWFNPEFSSVRATPSKRGPGAA